MFLRRTVFGNSPEPQSLKEPKSLYQSPSGASGWDLTQSCKISRSLNGIWRCSTRSRMCCHTSRGRLENRIFGNRPLSEDGANQIPAGFVLLGRIFLFHEPEIRGFKILFGVPLRADSPFRKTDEGAADGQMAFASDTTHFRCEWRRDRDTLPQRLSS